jgi:hypothetical protein
MNFKKYSFVFAFLFFAKILIAQDEEEVVGGFKWGIKGGPTIATQKWSGNERNPLFRYHGVAFIESYGTKSSVYAQAGYHVRGSSTRYGAWQDPLTGQYYRGFSQGYQFRNTSLSVGAIQYKEFRESLRYFYGFGIRGEYNINTNLPKGDQIFSAYFPYDDPATVKKLVGGMDISGGFEKKMGDLTDIVLQFTLSPDFTRQYFQFPIPNIRDPYTGQNTNIPQQDIRNLSLEVSLGIKFWRKVVYE